jgi:hypothetical protein
MVTPRVEPRGKHLSRNANVEAERARSKAYQRTGLPPISWRPNAVLERYRVANHARIWGRGAADGWHADAEFKPGGAANRLQNSGVRLGASGARGRPERAAARGTRLGAPRRPDCPVGSQSPARGTHLPPEHRDRVCPQTPAPSDLGPVAHERHPVQRARGDAPAALVDLHGRSVLHLRHQRRAGGLPPLGDRIPRRRRHRGLHRGRGRTPPCPRRARIRQPARPRGLSRHSRGSRSRHLRVRGRPGRHGPGLRVLLARMVSLRGARIRDAGSGDPHLDRRRAHDPQRGIAGAASG